MRLPQLITTDTANKLSSSPNTVCTPWELRLETVIKTLHYYSLKILPRTGEELMIGKENSKTKTSPQPWERKSHTKCIAEPELGFSTIHPVTLFLNQRHSCTPLPADNHYDKTFPPTVFDFLQKLPNGRDIFQTTISSARKSYDGLQKYCKSMQADHTPMTSKDWEAKRLHVCYTPKALSPHCSHVFPITWSSPSENSF